MATDARSRLAGWGLACLAPPLLTAVLNVIGGPSSRDYAFLYVGLVAVLGVSFGLRPTLLAAIASFLLVDWFFVPPYHTLTIANETDIVNLLVLLGAAGLVGGLGSMRRNSQLRSEALARELTAANRELARLNREQAASAQVALRLARTEEQVRALEESDRSRREFLANVSHDLRTPIATILTESTAALESDRLTDPTRTRLAAMATEARRLNSVVTDILDMARIEGNALDLDLEPVDLAAAIAAAAERLARLRPERVVAVTGDGGPTVLADWRRLGQMLDNLLANADAAAPPDTAVEVAASVEAVERRATVRVGDHGPGIPPELGDQVFDRFVRGAGGRGTGLGLAIVRGLAEAQAGRAWIEPSGGGAVVAFSLPLAEPG